MIKLRTSSNFRWAVSWSYGAPQHHRTQMNPNYWLIKGYPTFPRCEQNASVFSIESFDISLPNVYSNSSSYESSWFTSICGRSTAQYLCTQQGLATNWRKKRHRGKTINSINELLQCLFHRSVDLNLHPFCVIRIASDAFKQCNAPLTFVQYLRGFLLPATGGCCFVRVCGRRYFAFMFDHRLVLVWAAFCFHASTSVFVCSRLRKRSCNICLDTIHPIGLCCRCLCRAIALNQ